VLQQAPALSLATTLRLACEELAAALNTADLEAANLMFSLVSARYERVSLIVTSNKPFSAWGEIFGDEVVAAA
jgi:hypothetical protein